MFNQFKIKFCQLTKVSSSNTVALFTWSSHLHCKFGEQTTHNSLAIFTLWAARENKLTYCQKTPFNERQGLKVSMYKITPSFRWQGSQLALKKFFSAIKASLGSFLLLAKHLIEELALNCVRH